MEWTPLQHRRAMTAGRYEESRSSRPMKINVVGLDIDGDSGRVALDAIRERHDIDLALIDLVMPVMNGRQLATRIRAADPARAILFMTGYDDLSDTDDPFASEMVIKKPFKLVELAAAVERSLAVRDREQPAWNVTPIRQPKRT